MCKWMGSNAEWSCRHVVIQETTVDCHIQTESELLASILQRLSVCSAPVYLRRIMDMLGYKQADPTPIVIVWSITLASVQSRALICTTGQNILMLEFIASRRCRNQEKSISTRSREKSNQQTFLQSRCPAHLMMTEDVIRLMREQSRRPRTM